jgi:ABC-type multidrug transport system ATPase subunit
VHEQTAELIKYLGLEGIEHSEAASMSYGGQRLVDMGIALGCHPKVLLLDEATSALDAESEY